MATTPVVARGRARRSIPPPSPGVTNDNVDTLPYGSSVYRSSLSTSPIKQGLNHSNEVSDSFFRNDCEDPVLRNNAVGLPLNGKRDSSNLINVSPVVNAVIVLPKFWQEDAELWFSTIEHTFLSKRIFSESARLECLLTALDRRHIRQIAHIIFAKDAQNAYSQAKAVLLSKYALDQDSKIEQLLYDTKLTSEILPSELLAQMRHLIGESKQSDSALLHKIFLDQLPIEIRRHVAANGETNIDAIAGIADRMIVAERRHPRAAEAGWPDRQFLSAETGVRSAVVPSRPTNLSSNCFRDQEDASDRLKNYSAGQLVAGAQLSTQAAASSAWHDRGSTPLAEGARQDASALRQELQQMSEEIKNIRNRLSPLRPDGPEPRRVDTRDTNFLLKREIAQLANEVKKINSSLNANAPSYRPKTQNTIFARHANLNKSRFSPLKDAGQSFKFRAPTRVPVGSNSKQKEYPEGSPLCFYHWKFGSRALSCSGNCAWESNRRSPVRAPRSPSVGTVKGDNSIWVVRDPCSKVSFTIDTGSCVSLLPLRASTRDPRFSGFLTAANGTKIATFDKVRMSVTLGMPDVFTWDFLQADVERPVIGLDFLSYFNIALNTRDRKFIVTEQNFNTPTKQRCNPSKQSVNSRCDEKLPTPKCVTSVVDLESFYPRVFEVENFKRPTRHQTKHHIRTRGPPTCERVRRLSPEKMDVLKLELNKLLNLGIIERAESAYASPLHLVPKKNGEYRITGDYRKLNQQTVPDKYAIPLLSDFTAQIAGSKYFSSLDLYKSYHQIEVAPEDVHKTAIITPLGNYVFKRVPMGIKCAANSFQKFMDEVFRGQNNVFVYIDDVLIFSDSYEEHLRHLSEVFNRLNHYGLILNKEKCVFGVSEIDFLGHKVNENGIKPLEAKTRAIREFPRPKTMKDLRRFLGLINFYRRFIENAAKVLSPLERVLSPKIGSRKAIRWDNEMENAFLSVKAKLADVAALAYPVKGAETFITVDASDTAVGGVLNQVIDGQARPLGFFSRSLSKTQQNYSTYDRELLAVYLTVKHFRYFLESREFHVFSDHRPLTSALTAPLRDAPGRRLRQAQYITQFTTDIRYIKGENNVVADCLSRPPNINAIFGNFQSLSLEQIAAEQANDPAIIEISSDSSLNIQRVPIPDSNRLIAVDVSRGTPRVLVPKSLRKQIFDSVHSLSHPGVKVSREMIGQRFVWEGMRKDVANFVKTCIACQQSKIQRHNKAPVETFLAPQERFSHIHVDIVGELPESSGYAYLLTIIDRFTKHFECVPVREITAKAIASAFTLNWVGRFGCPQIITCDRGAQFTSRLWTELCNFLGCKLVHTCSFHPDSNGQIERYHRTLKAALKAQENPYNWYDNLGFVLLGMRASPNVDSGISSAEMRLGTTVRLPGQFFESSSNISQTEYCKRLSEFMRTLRAPPSHHHGEQKSYLDRSLRDCSHVFIRNDGARSTFERPYKGPFLVLNKTPKFFTVDLGQRRDVISIDRLKAAHLFDNLDVENDDSLTVMPGPVVADAQVNTRVLRTRSGRSVHPPPRFAQFFPI